MKLIICNVKYNSWSIKLHKKNHMYKIKTENIRYYYILERQKKLNY